MLRAIHLRICCCLYLEFICHFEADVIRYDWVDLPTLLLLLQVKDPPPLSQSFVFPEHNPYHVVPSFPYLAPRHILLVWIIFLPI